MDLAKLKELIEILEKSQIDRFVYREKGIEIELEKGGKQHPSMAPFHPLSGPLAHPLYQTYPHNIPGHSVADQSDSTADCKEKKCETVAITAPMIGIFYSAAKAKDPPMMIEGQKIKKGDVIGLIEAMKTFYEVKATLDGEVMKIYVKDQERVDLASKIVEVRPA